MDIIQPNNKNKEALQQNGGPQNNVVNKQFRTQILEKTEVILEELKDRSVQREAEWMVYLLALPLFFVISAAIIKWGVLWRIIPLLALIAYLIYFRWKMIHVTKEALKVKLPSEQELRNESVWLKSKIAYLLSGLEVRITRTKYISWMYCLFCPWLLYFLLELFKEPPLGVYSVASILFAYLIGGVFWLFHFRKDIEENESSRLEFENYTNQL